MKNRSTILSAALTIALLLVFSLTTFSQKSTGVKKVTDYTSIAKVTSYTNGVNITYTNPYSNSSQTSFAGAFDGTLNSQSKKFFCIDLSHNLALNEDYWDEGTTPSEITYILNNYYPYKTGYAGALSDNNKEAASVQVAIWHFSDGVDPNTITDATVKNRAIQIIADANANHNNIYPLQSLLILPASSSYVQGSTIIFNVFALDLNGNPLSNKNVTLTTTLGTLSLTSGTTDANGKLGPISLTYSGVGTATVSAQAVVEIPQGTRYVHKTNPNGKQKLVLATPVTDTKKVDVEYTWYVPQSNECDTKGYTTYTQGGWGSPSNSVPGKTRDLYFNSVFPSGLVIGSTYKLTLTNSTAVKNFLPQGGTAAAFTQNYTNVTSTSAGVLAGQLVALKLNVAYDAAGYLGSNSVDLGNLIIASGPFIGKTVNQFLTLAEQAIGGGSLNGYTFSQFNDAATAINENFDNGTIDKGFLICEAPTASIGNKVWEDLDKDGIQDNNEPGIQGVTVILFDCNNNQIAQTTTNANGEYFFSNLAPGSYYVKFVTPAGMVATLKDQGSDDEKDSDADVTTGKTVCTDLLPGENDLSWDAGFYKECKNKIGDYVWHDKNVNGIQDAGEPGIAGVKVELLQGSSIIATTTTDAIGKYEFNNLANGTYLVRVAASNYASGGVLYSTAQTKWYATKKNQGTDDTKDSDANKNESVTVTLNCNDNITIDFGFYKTCVKITKTADKQTAQPGDVINYTLTTENCGDVELHGGVDIVDAMLGINVNVVLNPGQTHVINKAYTVKDTDCGNLINNASATGHPVDGSANVVDNASFTVIINCEQKADLKVEKTVDNQNPNCNEFVNFTVKVTNLGPNTATNVILNDLLPAGLLFDSYTATKGSYNNVTGVWTVGNMNSGTFETITIKVKVDCASMTSTSFDLGQAKDFNLFVLNDLTQPSSDTEGKVAVGHNANLSAYSIGDKLPANSGDVLIVGNDLTYTSGQVFNGNVVYGNTTNLPIYAVTISGGTLRKDNPIDFAAAANYLQTLSTTLGGYTVNGTTTFQWGGLTLTGNDPFLNVFAVNGSDLSSANSVTINVPNGSVVLVNINGANVSWTGGLVVNGTAINNVLYNFYQATSLTISGIDVRGSILAPFANLNFPAGVVTGQVIVKNMSGSGQFNLSPFQGNIPVDKKTTNIATVTSSTTDPNTNNNSSSVTITVGSTSTGGNNNGSGSGSGSWTNVCSFGQGEIIYTIFADGSTLYAGTYGGKVYKSTNAGQTWMLISNGLNVNLIWAFTQHNNKIYAATENGVYMYNGSYWTSVGLNGKDVHTLNSKNGILYAGTWGYGVYTSSDNGATWNEFNNGLSAFLTVQALTSYNTTIFAGTIGGGLYKSVNGSDWTKALCGSQLIWSLASKSGYIFAGTYGDGIYRSTDGGLNFTKLASSPVAFVYSIAIDGTGKVYVSSVANGVFVSSDNGDTWTAVGLSGSNVSSLVVSPNSGDVYAGTKDGVMYKISGNQNTTDVDDINGLPTEFSLSQNYPNPFNPSTTIEFAVKEAGNYSLKVYDMLGQEVATLINNNFNAGTYKVNFDASKLSSGIYIYRLIGNNVNLTKKMILTK